MTEGGYRLLYCAAAAAPEKTHTPGFKMTRFALIPLAILANACASSEEVQDNLADTTHELQREIDELTADTDRETSAYRQVVYERTRAFYENRLQAEGCEMVGALTGSWENERLKVKANVIDMHGEIVVNMEGSMRFTGNDEGIIGTKGYIAREQTHVIMEGDWQRGYIEADMLLDSLNDRTMRVVGLQTPRGYGGDIVGAVARCD